LPFATPKHVAMLQQLCDKDFKLILHSSDFVGGIIFAVCAAPEIPMPDEWLNWTFKQRGQLASTQQADTIAEVLMSVLQEQLREMRADTFHFPMHGSKLPESPSTELPISKWLSGLLLGHSQLQPVWQHCWQHVESKQADKLPTLQRDLKHCLMMFSTFANIPLAIEEATRKGNLKLLDNFDNIFAALPEALKTYVDLSGTLTQFLPDQFETFVQTH